MAKQRPTLGTYASPVGSMVVPVMQQAQPIDEKAIRDTYAFAEAFGDLSQSMVELASVLKTQSNKEQFAEGQKMVNANRKTYAELVKTGQINPSENPWMAVGAQTASGVLEASKSRNEFEAEYSRRVADNPDLLKDNEFFDALAASYAQNKQKEFGTASYLSNAFFDSFNPYMVSKGAEHAGNVAKYRQQKIVQSIQVKIEEGIQEIVKARKYGKRTTGEPKDVGFLGEMYSLEGDVITELSTGIEIDGKEYEIPLIVPGLSIEAKEMLVYDYAEFADLPLADRNVILEHARKRLSEGRSAFYSTAEDRVFPDIQAYMDETGANMGMPRTANMAAAAHLVGLMAESPYTYEAEEMLRNLRGGTGPISDTEEVKVMLSNASADIQKNRFALKNSEEKTQVGLFMEQMYANARDAGQLFDEDAAYRGLEEIMAGLSTFTVEDRGRMRDQLTEKLNNAVREGQETIDRAEARMVRTIFSEQLQSAAEDRSSVINWGSLRTGMDNILRSLEIDPASPKAKDANRQVRDVISTRLGVLEAQLTTRLAERSVEFGRPAMSVNDLRPQPGDTPEIRDAKQQYRAVLKLNQLEAARHFGITEYQEGIRRIFANGISVDVERGVRSDLADVISLYRTYRGQAGQVGALEIVLQGMGERGSRGSQFLSRVSAMMDGGMDMPNAVRDAVQQLNLQDAADISQLGSYKPGEAQQVEIRNAATSLYKATTDRIWGDFGLFDYPVQRDSEMVVTSLLHRKYIEFMYSTGYDHEKSLEQAKEYVGNNVALIRGSHIQMDEVKQYGLSTEYLASAADMEAPNALQPMFVFVGFGGNGQSVYALRDANGNSVNERYYTVADLASNEKPRDELGRPYGMSFRERVVKRQAEFGRAKRLTAEEAMRIRSSYPLSGKSKM